MSIHRWGAILIVLLSTASITAQTITGSISGSVQDASGTSVPQAEVAVIQDATRAQLKTSTDMNGGFVFTGLLPGTYSVTVAKEGFRKAEQTGIVLTAGERRSAGTIVLEVGAVTEKIEVIATPTAVQTVSAERSAVVTSSQATDLMLIGRDSLDLLRLLPGVNDTSVRDAPGVFMFNASIQGGRAGMNNLTLDGVTNQNTAVQTGVWFSPNVDAIAEVKILLNNYQAEYGRKAGASVNVITKSGSQEFHGTGYYFKRNEAFNANEYFYNQRNVSRPRYRYDFGGFNVGGPVYIPGKFNAARDKLFFFFSQEFLPVSAPNTQYLLTVPTGIERQGDFSQTLDQNRKLVVIKDPSDGLPLPGNVIPANRIDANMQKLLGVFPAPNFADPAGAYNYIANDTMRKPRKETLFRVDYRFSDKHSVYVRGVVDHQKTEAGYGHPAQGCCWALLPSYYEVPSKGLLVSLQQTFSPTLIHQFTGGITRSQELVGPLQSSDIERLTRKTLGYTLGQFNPQINYLDLIPNASFGGVPNAAAIAVETRFPFYGNNNIFDFTDNVTKVAGSHTLKAGIFLERIQRAAKRASTFAGSFDFSRDVNNPLDTNWAYSNALLGVFRSYSESDRWPWSNVRSFDFEWYLQDTWKVSRRLTLDYGLRFSIMSPIHEKDGYAAGFTAEHWDPAQAAVLVRPAKNASGTRVGLNPVTGDLVPAVLIGSFAKGDPANGMVANRLDPTYPSGLVEGQGVLFGPRVGFAYDVTGNGKTAIRGGFGITYDHLDSTYMHQVCENPPLRYTPTSYYGRVSELLGAAKVLFPSSVTGFAKAGQIPTTLVSG